MTDQIPVGAVRAAVEARWPLLLTGTLGEYERRYDNYGEDTRRVHQEQVFAEVRDMLIAALPYLRPEPSEDDREATATDIAAFLGAHLDVYDIGCSEYYGCSCGWNDDVYDVSWHQAGVLAAAGFTRRPMPSREQVARVIYDCDDLERAVLADAESIADAVLALFKGGDS